MPQLFAICWQDTSEPWGWAPVTWEGDVQPFHWSMDAAQAELRRVLDAAMPQAMSDAVMHWRGSERAREESNARLRRAGPRMPGVTLGGVPTRAVEAPPRPEPREEQVRAGLGREYRIEVYEVPPWPSR